MRRYAMKIHRCNAVWVVAALAAGSAGIAQGRQTSGDASIEPPSATASVAAHCEVDPASLAERPAARGEPRLQKKPATDVHVRVIVAADGTATEAALSGDGDLEATRRSALKWRYRCQGNQGGVAEWTLHYPEQQCSLDISSKSMNPPAYPAREYEAKVQGTVLLGMQPREDMRSAHRVFVAQSSGSVALDDAALEAAKRWQFSCRVLDAGESEPAQEVEAKFLLQ